MKTTAKTLQLIREERPETYLKHRQTTMMQLLFAIGIYFPLNNHVIYDLQYYKHRRTPPDVFLEKKF